jgi:hypothetical protein
MLNNMKVQDTLDEKLCAIKCESGNVEVQWNNIKKCVLATMSDWLEKSTGKQESREMHRK